MKNIFRAVMMLALVFTVTACTKNKPQTSDVAVDQNMTAGPLDGMTPPDGQPYNGTGPAPGSQQDLVVNIGDRVFFGYDQYNLTPEAQHVLEMQANWMKQYPNVNVTIAGHCDERGTREYNLALGERRANSVRSYLQGLGIDGSRVQTISYGKERPAVMGSDPAAWAQNRRGVTEVN